MNNIKGVPGVESESSFNFSEFRTINNLSRQYLMLMAQLQESSLMLSLFSHVCFEPKADYKRKHLPVMSTGLTPFFLTSGLVVYQITSLNADFDFEAEENDGYDASNPDKIVKFPLEARGIYGIPAEDCEYRRVVLKRIKDKFGIPEDVQNFNKNTNYGQEYTNENGEKFLINVLFRQSGCGYKLPENAIIQLNPQIMWTQAKLKFDSKLEGVTAENDGIYIINFAGGIEWYRGSWEVIRNLSVTAFMEGDNHSVILERMDGDSLISGSFQELSNSQTTLTICDNQERTITETVIVMPFICAAFDMVTAVRFNGVDEDQAVILFTT